MKESGGVSRWKRRTLLWFLATVGALTMTASVSAQSVSSSLAQGGDVMRGWRAFHSKKCVDCHAIWDYGGRVGPDLGRVGLGRLTNGQLAGVMWNHIPKMLGQMEQTGRPPVTLSREEMADLFAMIFFIRQLDELGDPVRGESILRVKGCSDCHETGATGSNVGPDLDKWARHANPIAWAQLMWEHAPVMEEAMRRSGMEWPKLEGSDLVHIVAYVRSSGVSGEKAYLQPGSVGRGEALFKEKNCHTCHPGSGPDLGTADLPTSVGALASRMWNHSPSMLRVMAEQDIARKPLTAQELADIVAYILALGGVDRGGDAAHGKRVFARKGCVQCHDSDEISELGGPSIKQLGADATPVNMAAAMWNHGKTMLERMTEAGVSWPVFDDREMVHLLAYLKMIQAASRADAETNR